MKRWSFKSLKNRQANMILSWIAIDVFNTWRLLRLLTHVASFEVGESGLTLQMGTLSNRT